MADRFFLISLAKIGPKRFHQNRTVRSTALRTIADIDAALEEEVFGLPQRQGIAEYIITVRRMTSGELLK